MQPFCLKPPAFGCLITLYLAHPAFASEAQDSTQSTLISDLYASRYGQDQLVNDMFQDGITPKKADTETFSQVRQSISYQPANDSLIYAENWRYDYTMSYSDQLAKAYWQYKNNQPITTSPSMALNIHLNQNERYGIALGKHLRLSSNWQITPKLNYWQGRHAIVGDFNRDFTPSADTLSPQQFLYYLNTAHADINYHYDKPLFNEPALATPDGYGYSLDFSLAGQLSDTTKLSVDAYDVLGRMHWRHMPTTVLNVYVHPTTLQPIIVAGKQVKENYTQQLHWYVQSTLAKQLSPKWAINVQSEFNEVSRLHQLQASYLTHVHNKPLTITPIVEPQTHAVGIGLAGKNFAFKWLSDDRNNHQSVRGQVLLSSTYQW